MDKSVSKLCYPLDSDLPDVWWVLVRVLVVLSSNLTHFINKLDVKPNFTGEQKKAKNVK